MNYRHTQNAPLHFFMHGVAALIAVLGAANSDRPPANMVLFTAAGATVLIGLSFKTLTISDEGDFLRAQYGPLPLFSKRIPYADMTAAEAGRSTLIDGFGIHYVPGRGWIYNLWGWDCVKISLGAKTIRLGTDDAAGLAKFLTEKIEKRKAGTVLG